MQHLFFINPRARDGQLGRLWAAARPAFLAAFPDMREICPDSAEDCVHQAQAQAGKGRCLVAVGGEGSMNMVMRGIMQSDAVAQTTMAIVPFGNVNDYAANIGMKKTWQHALSTLQAGKTRRVGVIELETETARAWALNTADIGFGASTARRHSVDHQLPWIKGQLKYNLLALKTLLRWHNVPSTISVDGEIIAGDIAILLTGFSPTLGGFWLVPHAAPDTPKMAVTIGRNATRREILGFIHAAKKNRLSESEQLLFRQASHLVIEGRRPFVAQVDGEIVAVASRRLEFRAHPRVLNFMVP